jgi:streptogramin lyase
VAGAGSIWTDNHAGGISRVNPVTGRVEATIRIRGCCDGDLMYANGLIWLCNTADGQLYRIAPATNRVVFHASVGKVPRTMALAGGRLWITHTDTGVVSWHSPTTAKQQGSRKVTTGFVGGGLTTDDFSIWFQTLDHDAVLRLATGST